MSRKPEQTVWDTLDRTMKGHWSADRMENKVGRNIPDVWFRFGGENAFTGWIELKQIFRWNPRKLHPTKVPHFTSGQKKWLRDNHRANANCWLLLHVRLTNEYLFIPGDKVSLIGDVTQSEAYGYSYETFQGIPASATIRSILESKGIE